MENGPKTIKIDDVEYVEASRAVPKPEGEYAVVRCRNAGVHAGYVQYRKDGILRLVNSRRLWRWWSKFTLSGLATVGVLPSKRNDVRFACVVPILDLTESDVCEVIYATREARESIESIPEHKNT
jgi:hypothetical protein